MFRRTLSILAVAALTVSLALGFEHGDGSLVCTDDADGALELELTNEDGEALHGLYAAPADEAKALAVMMHGYSHTSESWRPHVVKTAAGDSKAVAVAIDYRGDIRIPPSEEGELTSSRGWNVTAGAEDAIDVAHAFLDACDEIERVVVYGISMGGNSSGLAVADNALRDDGSPLFDVWFDIEGATNVIETYFGARSLAPVNEFAANAQEDIETEAGGPIEETGPQAYADLSVLYHADQVAAARLEGVVMVHGVDDGLVPYNQSRQMAETLRAMGIDVELHTVVGKGDGEQGTTATGYVLGPLGQDFFTAGHASEASETHVINRIAFARLAEVLAGAEVDCSDAVYDGTSDQANSGRDSCALP